MSELSHLDQNGNARMVDVGEKGITQRRALATGSVLMEAETLRRVIAQDLKKGDVLAVARIAGIMSAKRTSDLIPLCHHLDLSHVRVELEPNLEKGRVDITAEVASEGRTGVEMEALTAVSIAALTVYDMVKAIDKSMIINDIKLIRKSGGRSGDWIRV
jgi:cyclic pyranopterin phosphate synthase